MNTGFIILCFFLTGAYPQDKYTVSEDLEIMSLTENTLIHISYMENQTFGRFSCNGLIYINNNEAVIIDTPPDTILTSQLLKWLSETYPRILIKGVIATHFHQDCLGGLNEFHKLSIKSYAYELTPALARENNLPVPGNTFSDKLELNIGKSNITGRYMGEAHSKDNIVVWIPDEKILFGGCMVKSIGSSKGNLSDSNVNEWANTVKAVKKDFVNAKYVIPGHGDYGGTELLDYTIKLFSDGE